MTPDKIKRRRGRPKSSSRRPRNVQMLDEVYAWLTTLASSGKAADGLELLWRESEGRRTPISDA